MVRPEKRVPEAGSTQPDACVPRDRPSPATVRLTERARRGDREALREVWAEHRRWVAGILLAFKHRQADLEDLLQDVAMTMVRKIDTLKDPALLRPWLRAVAVNTARLDARARRRQTEARPGPTLTADDRTQPGARPGSPHRDDQGGVDLAQARREDGRRLLAMVLDLPEAYREPLLLRSVKGLSYREIAAITSLPETTIETRIARGRRMLREQAQREAAERTTETNTGVGRRKQERTST